MKELACEDTELVKLLQVWLGYCATGHTRQETFAIFHGLPAAGKSVLATCFQRVMKPLSIAASPDVVLMSEGHRAAGAADPHLAALRGKRSAILSEPDRRRHFHVEQMKALTSGDTMHARENYERGSDRNAQFDNVAKLMVLVNPNAVRHIPEDDDALWGRAHVIPCNAHYPRDEHSSASQTLPP